jgi:hypothetical protein
MAHFAQVDSNNKVQQVIVVSNDDCGGGDFPTSEPIGQAFLASLGLAGLWLQTSYNGSFRNCYAGIEYDWLPNAGEYGEFVEPPTIEPIDEP